MKNHDFSKTVTDNQLLRGLQKACLTDTTSSTIIYEGFKYGEQFRICKIDLSTPVISRTWATGSWENRATLNYE